MTNTVGSVCAPLLPSPLHFDNCVCAPESAGADINKCDCQWENQAYGISVKIKFDAS